MKKLSITSLKQMYASLKEDEKLRKLLRNKAEELRDTALRAEREKSPDITSLEEASKILQLCEATRVRLSHDFWLVVIVCLLIVLFVSGFLYLRVGKTEVELELALTDLEFTLSQPMLLIDTLHLSELGFLELAQVQLPRLQEHEQQILRVPGDGLGFALKFAAFEEKNLHANEENSTKQEQISENVITLTSLYLPADTVIHVRWLEAQNTYRLKIAPADSAAMDIQISLNGIIQIKQSGAGGLNEQFEFPSQIRANTVSIQPTSDELVFDFTVAQHSMRKFVPLIPAREFDFTRTEEFGKNTSHPYSRRVSSLLAGKLILKKIENKQYAFKYGDHLSIQEFDGIIRQVILEEDHIAVALHGIVGAIETGPGQEKSNLMPSWFERLRANHELTLLWGTSVSLFGIVFIVLRWWMKAL